LQSPRQSNCANAQRRKALIVEDFLPQHAFGLRHRKRLIVRSLSGGLCTPVERRRKEKEGPVAMARAWRRTRSPAATHRSATDFAHWRAPPRPVPALLRWRRANSHTSVAVAKRVSAPPVVGTAHGGASPGIDRRAARRARSGNLTACAATRVATGDADLRGTDAAQAQPRTDPA
jgi:hypothetical protein